MISYFGSYGSIRRVKILNEGRTFLLSFDDADATDRILLDQPHSLNSSPVKTEKCYDPYLIIEADTCQNPMFDEVQRLKGEIQRLEDQYQAELTKLQSCVAEDIAVKRREQLEAVESCNRLRSDERSLKEKIQEARRTQVHLKEKIQKATINRRRLVEEYKQMIK